MVVMPIGMPAPGTVYGSLWVLTWTGSRPVSSEHREGEQNLYVSVQGTVGVTDVGERSVTLDRGWGAVSGTSAEQWHGVRGNVLDGQVNAATTLGTSKCCGMQVGGPYTAGRAQCRSGPARRSAG